MLLGCGITFAVYLWRVTREVYLNFGEINRNLNIQKDVVYQSLYATIAVQSLLQTSLQRYIMVIYRFALRDIVAANSRQFDTSARYREDCTDISRIYRFSVRQSVRFIADISARNCENKARYSSIIVCITFAQYCNNIFTDNETRGKRLKC